MGLVRSSDPNEVILDQNRRCPIFAATQILISPESCQNPENLVQASPEQQRPPLGLDPSTWTEPAPVARNPHQLLGAAGTLWVEENLWF